MVTNRAKLIARLQANEDDLLIMGQVPTELAVKAHPFIDNELLVVAPPDHPLIRRWYAVHLHNKTLSPTARTFLEFILDESGAILSF
jgi:DNA-binding transcriptional LysR family regulator